MGLAETFCRLGGWWRKCQTPLFQTREELEKRLEVIRGLCYTDPNRRQWLEKEETRLLTLLGRA